MAKLLSPKEVLDRIEGLSRSDLTVWERQGYIKPIKTRKGRVYRRKFTEKEFRKIQLIRKNYRTGMRLRVAYERALTELELIGEQHVFSLASPRVSIFSTGIGTTTSELQKLAERLRNIILQESPKVLIVVSSAANLVVGSSLAGLTPRELTVVPIEKSDEYLLEVTLERLNPEDSALVIHDGSYAVLNIIRETKLNISDLEINEII